MTTTLPLTSPEFAAKYRAMGLWKDETITERFLSVAEKYPEKTAVIMDDEKYSYAELTAHIKSIAQNLLALGLKSGDVVAGQLPNCPQMPMLHFACNLIGLLYIPLHDSWRELELSHLMKVAKVKLLVCPQVYRDFNHLEMIEKLRSALPELEHIYTLDNSAENKTATSKDFSALLKPAAESISDWSAYRPDPDLPASVMLSGGTTSLSKIARFSSNDLLAMLDNEAKRAQFTADDISAAIAPAGTGATGYIYPIQMTLLYGATSVILQRWGDPAEAAEMIASNNCTYGTAIPTQLTKMVPVLEQLPANYFPQFRCFMNAGAPLPYETAAAIEKLMGCVIQSVYGATDGGTPTIISVDDPREKRLSTVGRVTDGCECQLWDEDGNEVATGKAGEVVWRGADKSWGYLGDEEQTNKVFTSEHFYKSGDLGAFDEDGYLQIVGRIKDMILRGGRNISPRLIEEAMMKHPAVQEIAVAAMPDAVLGEKACAFIQLRASGSLAFNEMVDFLLQQGLAKFQLPERLELMEELPRSTGAKVAKNKLTEMITEKLKQEAAS
jgi:non-ribosomal peptide synthetase component E (peptide arylation enzyme)